MNAALLDCAGAPRDLGLDQGEAWREAVRAETRGVLRARGLLSWLGLRAPDARSARVARDLGCHFPHVAERLAGLARGARVSQRALLVLLAQAHQAARSGRDGLLLAVSAERSGGGPLLARSLARGPEEPPWALRRSVPEHDHVSLDVVRPASPAALAGLNQRGLAVALASAPSEGADMAVCAAPAQLLVQDCLQRFDRVASAVEWCERRPAGGHAEIVLADATGDLAIVQLRGAERRVLRPADGLHVGVAAPARRAVLAKAAAAREPLDRAALTAALGCHEGEEPERPCHHAGGRPTAAIVVLDPVAGRLHFAAAPPCRAPEEGFATLAAEDEGSRRSSAAEAEGSRRPPAAEA